MFKYLPAIIWEQNTDKFSIPTSFDRIKINRAKVTFMATLLSESKSQTGLVISWEALPDDFQLE
ncbi:hypothetical protein CEP12_07570, partial [Cylindrospermopsis raciborskii S14]